jgi:glyoxylase-like metal-dependent hydrolase (beta-lactamase superfamily II)
MATASNPNPTPKRRRLLLLSVLIEHPTEGLILYETGAGDDYPEVVGPQVMDVFHRTEYTEDMTIQSQIAKTGHDIKDIKMIIMGHLHLDHAGGLEPFRKTGIPVYVHELELKHAYYCVATGSDNVYMPDHLSFDINWVAFHGSTLEIAPGINVHHSPGHTPGLSIIQVNMPKTGTWIFTSDQYQ